MSGQVMKLFEALSDVDEELLERCNQKVERKNTAAQQWFRRYGKAMAAGVCLIVAGAVSWGGYCLVTDPGLNSSGSAQSMEVAPEAMPNMAQSVAAADGGAADGNGGAEPGDAAMGNGTDAAAGIAGNHTAEAGGAVMEEETDGTRTASDLSQAAVTAASPEAAKQQTMQDSQSQNSAEKPVNSASLNSSCGTGTENDSAENENQTDRMGGLREQENALMDSRQVIPWEEACALSPFDSYLPTVLPAGYEPFSARRSAVSDQWDNVIFKWSDGEHIFYLNMTLGEIVTKEDLERRDGLNEYLAEDFRKELIPDLRPMEEPVSFTLFYGDGMRIDFNGCLTVDEMWEVVESISK